jgi:hypothetical protein
MRPGTSSSKASASSRASQGLRDETGHAQPGLSPASRRLCPDCGTDRSSFNSCSDGCSSKEEPIRYDRIAFEREGAFFEFAERRLISFFVSALCRGVYRQRTRSTPGERIWPSAKPSGIGTATETERPYVQPPSQISCGSPLGPSSSMSIAYTADGDRTNGATILSPASSQLR